MKPHTGIIPDYNELKRHAGKSKIFLFSLILLILLIPAIADVYLPDSTNPAVKSEFIHEQPYVLPDDCDSQSGWGGSAGLQTDAENKEENYIYMYNLQGRQIFNKRIGSESHTAISVKGLPAGNYYLYISSKGRSNTFIIVKD